VAVSHRQSSAHKAYQAFKLAYYLLNEQNIEKVTHFLQEIVQKKKEEKDSC
jgi:hypothetical protein